MSEFQAGVTAMKIEIVSHEQHDTRVSRAEADRRSMARLMAVAGHDLKQPIQVALLSIVRAVGEGATQAASTRLGVAIDALHRLNAELDDIARLSQHSGPLDAELRVVLLSDVAARVEKDWRAYAGICGVDLKVVLPRVFVETDPDLLATILRNLVGNAIKFSGPGGQVWVTSRMAGERITLDVHDSGSGIPEPQLERIFDAFERCDQEGRTEGLGLGLLIVRQTAGLLGHPLAVRSSEDHGSTFSIELPLISRGFPRAVSSELGLAH